MPSVTKFVCRLSCWEFCQYLATYVHAPLKLSCTCGRFYHILLVLAWCCIVSQGFVTTCIILCSCYLLKVWIVLLLMHKLGLNSPGWLSLIPSTVFFMCAHLSIIHCIAYAKIQCWGQGYSWLCNGIIFTLYLSHINSCTSSTGHHWCLHTILSCFNCKYQNSVNFTHKAIYGPVSSRSITFKRLPCIYGSANIYTRIYLLVLL